MTFKFFFRRVREILFRERIFIIFTHTHTHIHATLHLFFLSSLTILNRISWRVFFVFVFIWWKLIGIQMKNVGNPLLLVASVSEISSSNFAPNTPNADDRNSCRREKLSSQGCRTKTTELLSIQDFFFLLTSCLSRVIFKFDYRRSTYKQITGWEKRLEKREKSHLSRRQIPEFHSRLINESSSSLFAIK